MESYLLGVTSFNAIIGGAALVISLAKWWSFSKKGAPPVEATDTEMGLIEESGCTAPAARCVNLCEAAADATEHLEIPLDRI